MPGTGKIILAEQFLFAHASAQTAPAWHATDDISYMSDNVLLLNYLRPPHNGYVRTLEVPKTRGSRHDSDSHPYLIGPCGP